MSYFYNESFKKAVSIFGSCFNNITIKREANSTVTHAEVSVPISYSPIQKELARLKSDPTGVRDINIILPRMGFEITDIQRDSNRAISPTTRIKTGNKSFFTPVPYDISFTLSIMSKNMDDSLKIIEQIIPSFVPYYAISAQLLDNVDETWDIPLTLNNITLQDTYADDFQTRRYVIWTLDFTLKYYFFGPVSVPKVIKYVTVNEYSNSAMTNKDVKYTTQPGLKANGQPTSNLALTVDWHTINSTDNYGFISITNERPV